MKYLHESLANYFDINELRTFCLVLGVEVEELPNTGNTRTGIARELISYLQRQERLPELIKVCQEERPNVDWSNLKIASSTTNKKISLLVIFRALLVKHWQIIFLVLILEAILLIYYFHYKDLYLIPYWRWLIASGLLGSSIVSIFTKRLASETGKAFTVIAGFSFLALFVWQAEQILNPDPFPDGVFGITFAELGEGANYRRTETSIEITDEVWLFVCNRIEKSTGSEPCEAGIIPTYNGEIQIRRIGVINNKQTAEDVGNAMKASLVIWGRILVSDPNVTIRFQALEPFDKRYDPDFPIVLPIRSSTTDILLDLEEISLERDMPTIKQAVTDQATALSDFLLGLAAYMTQDFSLAREHFVKTVHTVENSVFDMVTESQLSLLYYYLGKSNHILGYTEDGQEFLLRARELDVEEPAIPLSLAFGYRSLGLQEEQGNNIDIALDLLKNWRHDNSALYDEGIAYYLLGETEKEIKKYEEILSKDPGFFLAYINLGRAYAEIGQFDKAELTLKNGLQRADGVGLDKAAFLLELARVYAKENKSDLAHLTFQEAIKSSPPNDITHFHYAQFLESEQEFDAAIRVYKEIAENSSNPPSRSRAFGEIARIYRRAQDPGSLEKAIENYLLALEQYDAPLLMTYLAETFYLTGDRANGRLKYEEAIALEQGEYYIFTSYARNLFQEGDYEQAAAMFERALTLQPKSEVDLQFLAISYSLLGMCQQAKQVLTGILNQDVDYSNDILEFARTELETLDC